MIFSESEQAEIDHLMQKRDQLLEKRSQLLNKWSDIQARKWIHAKRFPRSCGYYIPERETTTLSKEMEDEWKDSFFFTHTDILDELSFANLKPCNQLHYMQDQEYTHPLFPHRAYEFRHMLTVCESVIPCENGPRLILADPYGRIVTSVLEDLPVETAENWIGQIIDADIGFRMNSDEHPIKNAYATGYHKYHISQRSPRSLR